MEDDSAGLKGTRIPDAGYDHELQAAATEVCLEHMATDRKTKGLKTLQGLVWQAGYESGELMSSLYPDAVDAIKQCVATGGRVYIYSSGSRGAQGLFFKYTDLGDMRHLICGFFDTTSGGKKEAASYRSIADSLGLELRSVGKEKRRCVFVSDVLEEATASADAGFEAVLMVRPGNPEQPPAPAHVIQGDPLF